MSHFGSPQKTETCHSPSISTTSNSTSPSGGDGGGGGGGDVMLKWGHRKRSRASRATIEDASSSVHPKHKRISHTVPAPQGSKFSSASMPPPQLVSSAAASNGRARKDSPRNLEDLSAAGSESPSRNSQKDVRSAASNSKLCPSSGVERSSRRMQHCSGSAKCQKPSGSSTTTQASERVNGHGDSAASVLQQSVKEGGIPPAPATSHTAVNGDKVTVQVIEWPRICIALSRKEKEDDFLAMKGTKIPQRPKKRAKNVDRTLQYCFPGMWLSDLTRSRYEVREKKSMKKQKRRGGLKGMESLESDSE